MLLRLPLLKPLLQLLSKAEGGVVGAADIVMRKALTPFESGRRGGNAFESCAQNLGARLLWHLYADFDGPAHANTRERLVDR